ncbi:MAG: hypothetical protein IH899_03745, partial [Planctomycetes bacterium]|nr:hypothetical protein [Planctomycetota bacterium]
MRVTPRFHFALLMYCGVLFLGVSKPADSWASDAEKKPRLNVAAVVTVYRHNAHADVIVGRLLEGYHLNGTGSLPSLKLVSLYVEQKPKNDLSRSLAEKHGFRLCHSVEQALTLGTGKLAVNGVLLVAEHGSYPKSKTNQVIYPKRRLFAEIVKVFENSKRVVPVFSDKHLADNWNDAWWIYDTSQKMRIPLMAGSSLPPYRRLPAVDVRRNAELEEIIAVGYGGVESYGFHALEMLQCLAERREGGETGVNSVTCLTGDAVWQAQQDGLFDSVLLKAALKRKRQTNPKRSLRERVKNPALFSIRYNDGFRASVLMLSGATSDFSVAWKYKTDSQDSQKIESTLFAIENDRPFMNFTDLL